MRTAIPKKMSFDSLSQILTALGVIALYEAFNTHDLFSTVFGVSMIVLSLLIQYFRNSWNENRYGDKDD